MLYEGNEKYIFISYSHKDTPQVLPVIEALDQQGFRVWYDAGIEAGTEWPEYIEDHLKNAGVVLVFMSPNTIATRNCRNEINFALELDKEMLVVYLEETTLLKGMRLQLNSTQSMFKKHHSSEETFIGELVNARILQSCRKPQPVVEPVVEPQVVEAPKKFCKNCGKPMDMSANVCGNCGTPVTDAKLTQKPNAPEPAAPDKTTADPGQSAGKTSMILGIVALAMGAICSCLAACLGGFVPLVCAVVSIVMGSQAMNKSKAAGFENKQAKLGMTLSVVAIVVIVIFIIVNSIIGGVSGFLSEY